MRGAGRGAPGVSALRARWRRCCVGRRASGPLGSIYSYEHGTQLDVRHTLGVRLARESADLQHRLLLQICRICILEKKSRGRNECSVPSKSLRVQAMASARNHLSAAPGYTAILLRATNTVGVYPVYPRISVYRSTGLALGIQVRLYSCTVPKTDARGT